MYICKFNAIKPCGKCQPCRILAHIDLIKRLQIQWQLTPYAYFVSLTYADEFLPVFENGLPTLWKPDLNAFINLGKQSLPQHVVFAVGEYGGTLFGSEKAEREINPHYHLIYFFSEEANSLLKEKIQRYWDMGRTQVLNCSQNLITYISSYTTKKLTNKKSMEEYIGLDITPEFARYPRKPALGDMSEQYLQVWEQYGITDKIILNGKQVGLPKPLLKTIKNKLGKEDIKYEFQKIRQEKRESAIKEIMQLQKMTYSQALLFLNSQVVKQKKLNSDRKEKLRYTKKQGL